MAGGLAANGMKPFLAIYSTFLQRAYDQMLHDITRQKLNVFIGIDRSGLVGADGETHHGVFDIAFLRHMPNLVIMMPKDENEGQHMVKTAIDYNEGPIAMRFPRGNGYGVPMDEELQAIPIGTWEYLQQGEDATILTFGTTIPMAFAAAEQLKSQGKNVAIVNARFIKPMDTAMLDELFANGKPIITIEEAVLAGGFGSAVMEYAEEMGHTGTVFERVGIPDEFVEHGDVGKLLIEIHMTPDHVAEVTASAIQQATEREKV